MSPRWNRHIGMSVWSYDIHACERYGCCRKTNRYMYMYTSVKIIRESVDSLCRDGVDTPTPPYIHVGKAFTRTNVED